MTSEGSKTVDLGYAEECESNLITNRYFPSKIGGKPSWLELKNLPKVEELNCPKCQEPRIFLCQVYAPIESKEDCFHRTIFVFICKNEKCFEPNSAENIIAFRSQLPLINDYYSSEPPNDDEKLPAVPVLEDLCSVCGCRGPYKCSQCKNISYCSSIHQKLDWKYHKQVCKTDKLLENSTESSKLLFAEYEIVIEPEPETRKKEESDNSEECRLKEYEELVKSGQAGVFEALPESELAQFVSNTDDDKQFRKFKKKVEISPDQVLRYERDGTPLWITSKSEVNSGNIPDCENCGGHRVFEFQIMPQMLNFIKDYKMDWGVIAVYTCKESCKTDRYMKEFIIKQDIVSQDSK